MIQEPSSAWTFEPLTPFGAVIHSKQPGADLSVIPVAVLKNLIAEHRVIILRGFAPLPGNALPDFCVNLGEILQWEFGAVNELVVREDTRNYLYTNAAVPFHWDGAFVGVIPHYIFFHCDLAPAPGAGGETIFCDTTRLLEIAPPDRLEKWERVSITYTTEKIVHYGGSFTSRMIGLHPESGEKILRYAEPVADLNPVYLEIEGVPEAAQAEFLLEMARHLRDESVCCRHRWLDGDIVIADNFALLHGREAFERKSERRIRRVNIL